MTEKICITSQGDNLNSPVDPRFGRCQYFIIVDTQSLEFEAVKNPIIDGMGGGGVQSALFVASKGASAVLSGSFGPNASQSLQAAGIKMVPNVSGTVQDALEKYKQGL